jgi:hypothetical protein
MRAMIWMAAGAAGVVALVACHPIRQQPAPAGPPECPHSWERKGVPSQAWPTVDVPEFNDCQRFILVDTVNGAEQRSYSRGYFAIFANPDSALVAQRAYPLDGSPVTSGVPVAFIYADQGAYGPLRIARGGNCLYLYRDQRRWRARIVSAVTGQMGDAV